jgi:hypothetical protein
MTGDETDQKQSPARQRQAIPRMTWLLIGLIVLFFALGVLLVATGLLTPGGGGGVELPGPTAFTLTP